MAMTELVALADVKAALNVWSEDDDAILQLYIQSASRSVINYLKGRTYAVLGDFDINGQPIGPVTQEVQLATIMLVGFIYRNPDGNDSKEWERGYLPRPVTALLYPLRDPAMNGMTQLPGYGSVVEPPTYVSLIEEAPMDGTPYERKDGAWIPATAGGGTAPGAIASYDYSYNGNTSAPPSNGQLRMNNSFQDLASAIYFSGTSAPGVDVGNFLSFILPGQKLYIQDKDDATKYQIYVVVANIQQSGYQELTVAWLRGGATLSEGQRVIASFFSGA